MLKKMSLLLFVFALLSAPAVLSAQVIPTHRGSVPGIELYGGYSSVFRSYDHTSLNTISGGMNGWDAALKVPVPFFGSWLGAKGEVSGSYRNDGPNLNPRAYFFMLGPQVSAHLGKSTIFLHGLVGSAHLNDQAIPNLKSNNTFAVAVGGGIDVGLSRRWAWRLQGDFYNTNYQSTDTNVQEIVNSNGRFSTGPVLRF
jgi:opacity protein-like surface antigen